MISCALARSRLVAAGLVRRTGLRIAWCQFVAEALTFENWRCPVKLGGEEETRIRRKFEAAPLDIREELGCRYDKKRLLLGWTKNRVVLIARKNSNDENLTDIVPRFSSISKDQPTDELYHASEKHGRHMAPLMNDAGDKLLFATIYMAHDVVFGSQIVILRRNA